MLKTSTEAPGSDSAGRDRGPAASVRRHGLVTFYALAYLVSWLVWLPYVLSQDGLGVLGFSFPQVLGTSQGVAGFAVPALLLIAVTRGRLGYRPEPYVDKPARDAS